VRPPTPWRQALGARSRREGRGAEWAAALWLMMKGYQVLGFRLRTRAGEVDLLARRGRVLAVVEVKRRGDLDTALMALTPQQGRRLAAAGQALLHGRRGFAGLDLRIDMVALAPGRFPRHLRGVTPSGDGG
jgi:putative endonuclease